MTADELQRFSLGMPGPQGCPWQAASRLMAKGRPVRTAQTPDAGRGDALITAQSPLANRYGWPSTLRWRSVRTRPLGLKGRPVVASQAGPGFQQAGPLWWLSSSVTVILAFRSTLDGWI